MSRRAAIAAGIYLTRIQQQRGGAAVVAPVVDTLPSIDDLTPTVGQLLTGSDGTYTPEPTSYARQWYRDGVAIGSATNATYTTVDADFGKVLTYGVTPTGDGGAGEEAVSAATAAVAEVPVQSLGAELLANPLFSNWTTDNPDNWTVTGESGSDPMVTQVAAGGGAGTGAARFYSSATNGSPSVSQAVLTVGAYFETYANETARVAGTLQMMDDAAAINTTRTSAGEVRLLARAGHAIFRLRTAGSSPWDFTIDSASVKLVTPNTALTAPSADMRLDFFYTLPGSPVQGTTVWLLPRISDFASGNYWLVWLRYTGSQWDINLYQVTTHSRTSRIAASNIGATNGMRINANGSSWTLETTADGGDNWTGRGTVSNATYATATSVNVLHTSGVVAGTLNYAPAA